MPVSNNPQSAERDSFAQKVNPRPLAQGGTGVDGNISHAHFTAVPPTQEKDQGDNSASSQRARILAWLLIIGPLSTLQARRELDVMHPAARVQELREAGWNIITHWSYEETQQGRRHRVAKYVLLTSNQGAA